MNHKLTLPVQELIRAHEVILSFANGHGLPEDDCEAVLLYTKELTRQIERLCAERQHIHDGLSNRAA